VLLGVTLAAAAAAQHTAPQLEVEFDAEPAAAPAADCAAFLRAAAARLRAGDGDAQPDVQPGADTTGPLLACLWLGDDARAGALLAREGDAAVRGGDRDLDWATTAWLLVHHYWFLRATGDAATVRERLPGLLARAADLAPTDAHADDGDDAGFAAAVLRLHAVACCGGILDSLDRVEHPTRWDAGPPADPPGAAWARRARLLLDDLERRFWSARAGMFAPTALACDGEHTPTAAANLLPCWIGMLATTGDKTAQNAIAALQRLGIDGVHVGVAAPEQGAAALAQAMAVVAVSQFGGDPGPPLGALLAQLPPGCAATGAAVDALLFAITGLRLATGPGIDEDWLRIRPALPPGVRRVVLRGLRHDGWRADLTLERRTGPPGEAEADLLRRCGETDARADPRLFGTLILRSPDRSPGGRRAVVHCGDRQLVARIRAGERLEFAACEGPRRTLLGGTTPAGARGDVIATCRAR
jgi:hypothetical protein